ncbi:T9SS type A sorting domain-containing protein [Paracrocinitomix mangrovi]|uniref:T9SS type A sorting domain-containing protein n=1 Tax=Paracrocinitomix mangrovi TaxID=2862509 RepID=UPI001C8E918D|nr:T9SS type A sorting domain-containing protein [Paracrocinitomix mangrovi]UKN03755.1 T9SS type A sorting domain-containing protein [Paracrocinitomix mangrovi]
MKLLFLFTFSLSLTLSQAQGFEWAGQIGGASIERPHDILIDKADGSVYLIGFFYGQFDPDPNGSIPIDAIDASDGIFVKLNSSGDVVWATHFGDIGNQTGTKMAFDNQGNIIIIVNASPKVTVYSFDKTSGNNNWFYSSDYSSQVNGYGIANDIDSNVYVVGTYSDTVDFDNTANTEYLIAEGNEDGFVLKLNQNGEYVWSKSCGNLFGGALFRDVEYHENNDLYISGFFHGQVDFDPSASINYLNATGSTDGFVMRMDTAGNYVWAKQIAGTSSIQCNGLAIKLNGNIVMCGYYDGTINLDPNGSTATFTEEGSGDIYVHELDEDGDIVWAKSIGGTAYDGAEGLTVDADGNVYVTGGFGDVVDFDPSTATFELDSGFAGDAFVLKLDSLGDFNWVSSVEGNNGFNRGYDVDLDADDNVYFTGTFGDTADLDPTNGIQYEVATDPMDWFVIKLNQDYFFEVPEIENNLVVYPNPSKDYLFIEGSNTIDEFFIFDMQGRIALSGNNTSVVDVRQLSNGQYVFAYTQNGIANSLSFVKE